MQEYGDIQHLRGSTAANAAHVGLPGTWTLDVEAGAIHIHDGVTPGGSFQIRSQQLLNAGISFKANPEHYIAASAQQEINPGAVDLSDPEKISVTVNKVRLKSGWSVSGPNIRFDQPLVGGEQIEVCNIHSLKEIVEQFSASPVDAEQLLQQVNQHLNSPATLQTLADSVAQSDSASAQIQQQIQQYASEQIAESVRAVTLYMPDTSAVTGIELADNYSIGQTVQFTPAGAKSPSGAPVIWKLTDLAGVSASKTDIADGQSATLTFTGPGSMTVTAVSNGVAAESYLRSWGASTAVMAAPSVLTPVAGTIALQPVITASAYSVSPAGYDTHSQSQCQIRKADGTVVWDSGEVAATTEFAVSSALSAETDIDIVVRYKGSRLGWGSWSALARRTTQAAGGAGVVYPDGGIGGPVVGGYRLIVASAAQRGQSIRHGLYGTDTSLTNITSSSTPDPQSGYDNTNTLINGYSGVNDGQGSTGPAAAQYCRDLGSDWYLPNKDELAAIVAMADEIDAADNSTGLSFADIGNGYIWIWSSTESRSTFSWVVRASDGSIAHSLRGNSYAVVPVRRVPV